MFSAAVRSSSMLAALTAFLLSGCGTLFNEQERIVTVDSSPPGAQVEIDGKRLGRTPLEVTVPNHKGTTVVVELPSHGSTVCFIDPQIEPIWIVLDIFLIVPLVVDAATGRWNDVPSRCMVVFGEGAQTTTSDPPPKPVTKPPRTTPKTTPKPKQPPAEKPAKPPTEKPTPFPFPK